MIYYFRKVAVLLLTFWLFALRTGQAMGTATYLELQPRPGNFCIAQGGVAAGILVGADDFPGVIRAAGDLQTDVGKVTGTTPGLVCGEGLGQR